ncbi:hypothetical protein PLANPX_5290 [Lacipirellula parvula]|uniref:Uncharacterized protein n=1 Tax=Lacipirellula parvula TaxID=2650471 RepID=A0A5K7XGV9_9BACT|nr:hypothetical protein PLANPX_5290 [Lacipirellula parvula]
MSRYFIAGNFWLVAALLIFIGKRYERSEPTMYTVFGVGRYFSEGEYTTLTLGTLAIAVAFFTAAVVSSRRPQG